MFLPHKYARVKKIHAALRVWVINIRCDLTEATKHRKYSVALMIAFGPKPIGLASTCLSTLLTPHNI